MTSPEGLRQLADLGLALVLSAAMGAERTVRRKSAGLRTHALVGLGAALFMLISKYGFNDVILKERIVLDPSRVAAQIVSGIGFLGAGMIFTRRHGVQGLTTAAGIWATAAVGAAAGAGLPILSVATAAGYFLVVAGFPWVERLVRSVPDESQTITVAYEGGSAALGDILSTADDAGYVIEGVTLSQGGGGPGGRETGEATLMLEGPPAGRNGLLAALSGIPSVTAVTTGSSSPVADHPPVGS
ncbi:MAG TPA: MgtC/SapB family protein [Actinomycetota bacterium]|nr:MgtC/SapB family protein [Actinomycetota bacterium]